IHCWISAITSACTIFCQEQEANVQCAVSTFRAIVLFFLSRPVCVLVRLNGRHSLLRKIFRRLCVCVLVRLNGRHSLLRKIFRRLCGCVLVRLNGRYSLLRKILRRLLFVCSCPFKRTSESCTKNWLRGVKCALAVP